MPPPTAFPTAQPPPSSYILSDSESNRIFNDIIVPTELAHISHLSPHPTPTSIPHLQAHQNGASTTAPPLIALLIVGQTGAGKSHIAPRLLASLRVSLSSSFSVQQPVHFIADTYKLHHPHYFPLLSSRGSSFASAATGKDARKWLTRACHYAAERGVPVLLESACRHPADFEGICEVFLRRGYRTQVVVMAVPEGVSRAGILGRFWLVGGDGVGEQEGEGEDRRKGRGEEQGDEGQDEDGKSAEDGEGGASGGLPVRLTPKTVHDESYAGLLEAARWIDSADGISEVIVVRRGGMVAFKQHRRHCLDDDQQQDRQDKDTRREETGVAVAVMTERERPLTEGESEVVLRDLRRLREKARGVEGLEGELDEVEGLLRPLMGGRDAGESEGGFGKLVPLCLPGDGDGVSIGEKWSLSLGLGTP